MFIAILLICSLTCIGIGIFAICKKDPMWFWAGTSDEVRHETIYNSKEFNRKSGIMWIIFGLLFLLPILLRNCFSFPDWILGIFLVFLCVWGIIVMMLYYEYLHDIHTRKP